MIVNLLTDTMENSQNKCPSLQQIEMLVVQQMPVPAEIKAHFARCPDCKNQFEELVQYYKLLGAELAAPVPNSVISFMQEIEAGHLLLSVIWLHPVERNVQGHPVFRCELIYQKLQDTSFIRFPEIQADEILLRLLQDHENLTGCAVILAQKPEFYKNVKLYFPNLDLRITTNETGCGHLDPIQPETLADQIVEIIP